MTHRHNRLRAKMGRGWVSMSSLTPFSGFRGDEGYLSGRMDKVRNRIKNGLKEGSDRVFAGYVEDASKAVGQDVSGYFAEESVIPDKGLDNGSLDKLRRMADHILDELIANDPGVRALVTHGGEAVLTQLADTVLQELATNATKFCRVDEYQGKKMLGRRGTRLKLLDQNKRDYDYADLVAEKSKLDIAEAKLATLLEMQEEMKMGRDSDELDLLRAELNEMAVYYAEQKRAVKGNTSEAKKQREIFEEWSSAYTSLVGVVDNPSDLDRLIAAQEQKVKRHSQNSPAIAIVEAVEVAADRFKEECTPKLGKQGHVSDESAQHAAARRRNTIMVADAFLSAGYVAHKDIGKGTDQARASRKLGPGGKSWHHYRAKHRTVGGGFGAATFEASTKFVDALCQFHGIDIAKCTPAELDQLTTIASQMYFNKENKIEGSKEEKTKTRRVVRTTARGAAVPATPAAFSGMAQQLHRERRVRDQAEREGTVYRPKHGTAVGYFTHDSQHVADMQEFIEAAAKRRLGTGESITLATSRREEAARSATRGKKEKPRNIAERRERPDQLEMVHSDYANDHQNLVLVEADNTVFIEVPSTEEVVTVSTKQVQGRRPRVNINIPEEAEVDINDDRGIELYLNGRKVCDVMLDEDTLPVITGVEDERLFQQFAKKYGGIDITVDGKVHPITLSEDRSKPVTYHKARSLTPAEKRSIASQQEEREVRHSDGEDRDRSLREKKFTRTTREETARDSGVEDDFEERRPSKRRHSGKASGQSDELAELRRRINELERGHGTRESRTAPVAYQGQQPVLEMMHDITRMIGKIEQRLTALEGGRGFGSHGDPGYRGSGALGQLGGLRGGGQFQQSLGGAGARFGLGKPHTTVPHGGLTASQVMGLSGVSLGGP